MTRMDKDLVVVLHPIGLQWISRILIAETFDVSGERGTAKGRATLKKRSKQLDISVLESLQVFQWSISRGVLTLVADRKGTPSG